jgi:hypothetical protein
VKPAGAPPLQGCSPAAAAAEVANQGPAHQLAEALLLLLLLLRQHPAVWFGMPWQHHQQKATAPQHSWLHPL